MNDETTTEPTEVDTAEGLVPNSVLTTGSPAEKLPADLRELDTPEPETFPRSYVEGLRQESGKYRQRAQQADDLAKRLHTELVRATGKLADPTDLPFSEDHLVGGDKLAAAIDDLLARKPHLASRRPAGDIGQGAAPASGTVDLAAILRQRAG
jgi:hypothetical protein